MKKKSKVPEVRRHLRDKATIHHLVTGPSKPRTDHKHSDAHEYGENEGRKLDKAIHKEWTPDKGGLPDF